MVKKALSLILCFAICLSCFSVGLVTASAAVVSAKSLFTVATKPVENNKLSYSISVTANQKNIAGAILVVEYDSTVLKPVNCGPAIRSSSAEGVVQNFEGTFVHGVSESNANMYSIAYMNTLSFSTGTTALEFFTMQFEIIDKAHPSTDIRFYCKEYYSTSEADKTISVEDGLQEIKFFDGVSTLEAPVTKSVVSAPGGLKVTWEPVEGADGYAIYRKTAATDWVRVGTAPGGDTTEYVDTGLESGKTYIYSVSASNNNYGESLRDTIGVSCKYIAKPVIKNVENAVGGVQIEWEGVSGASLYNIMRREVGQTEWVKLTSRSATIQPIYKDTTVVNGKAYEYDVNSATDTFESVTAEYGVSIYYVASPVITLSNTVDGIQITWPNNPYAVKYEVLRKAIGTETNFSVCGETINTQFVDKKVSPGKGYTYSVRTYTNDGVSAFNTTGYTITCVTPAKVNSLTLQKFGVKVEWSKVNNASSYAIYRKPADGGDWLKVGTVEAGMLSYVDNSVISGAYYVYAVCPVISNSESAKVASDAIYFIKAPGNIVAENIDDGIRVKWERSLGAVSYEIYRSVNGADTTKLVKVSAVNGEEYLDTDVQFGNEYSYVIKAISDTADSLDSDVSNTLIRIGKIGKATPGIADGGILVKWDSVSNVQNYVVFRTSGEGWVQVATVDEAQYLDTRVTSNTTYSYAVAAIVDGSRGVVNTDEPVEILYVAPPETITFANNSASTTVTWNQVDGAIGYEVYRATDSTGEFTLVASVGGNVLKYTDSNVESGKTYMYKVRSKSVEGYSAFSKAATNVFLAIPQISSIANSYTGITFSWKPVAGADSYRIYRKVYGAKYWTYITTVNASTFSYNDTEAVNGKVMCYTVKAMNGTSASAYLAKCMTAVDAPVLSISNSPSGVYLKWDKNDAAVGYWIYRRAAGERSWTRIACVKTTYYTDKNVKSGTYYAYTAKAYTGKILSSYNADAWLIRHLSTPVITSVAGGYQSVTCTWQKVPGAAAYYVYRKVDGAGNWSYVGKTTATTFADKDVKNGSTYTYTVKAYYASYSSSFNYSGKSAKYITSPTVTITNNISGVNLTWDKVSGASSYYVYRKVGNATTWTKIATVTKTNYTDTTVKSGTVYTYTVKAYASKILSGCNMTGWKTYYLSSPKLVSCLSYPDGVTLRWEKVTGATWYAVYRKGVTGSWTRIGTTTGNNKVTYIDKTAEKGKRYTYTVRACYGGYMSSYYTGEKITVSY